MSLSTCGLALSQHPSLFGPLSNQPLAQFLELVVIHSLLAILLVGQEHLVHPEAGEILQLPVA
ncbi:MAG: hypothetical protein ACYCWA_02565 [Thiobacillus sp.]